MNLEILLNNYFTNIVKRNFKFYEIFKILAKRKILLGAIEISKHNFWTFLFFFTADSVPQEGNGYCRTYSLPYGWKKIGYQRQEGERKGIWDFHVFSPCGRRFRSNPEIDRYLDQNPEVKCDRNVTNTSKSSDLNSPTRKIEIFEKDDKVYLGC